MSPAGQNCPTSHHELELLIRVGVGFGLSFIFGFERKLRGSPAGDRTFSVIGTAAAAMTAVVHTTSPQAVAGIVTGVGFIGAGVVLQRGAVVHGITTAASIFGVAAIGVVIGYGQLMLGTLITAGLLIVLESKHTPILRWLDPGTYHHRFALDPEHVVANGEDSAGSPSGN